MDNNTVNQITIPASTTGVVVQTLARAALKTLVQAFVAGLALTFSPWLLDLSTTLAGGGDVTLGDMNAGGKIIASAAVGAVASVISLATNFFGKTLPSGEAVTAQSTP